MNLDKKIKEKQAELDKLGKEINQLQQLLQQKQVASIKLDGAISQLKELNEPESK